MNSLKHKISVVGSSQSDYCGEEALKLAEKTGREIIRQGGALVSGAMTGVAYWAAKGAKEEKGISIGISPAVSEKEHIENYKLPSDYFDFIIYTGFGYAGRNLLLAMASDAIIIICGRMGTLNTFTAAFETNKPIGVLLGSGGAADMIKEITEKSHRGEGNIIYEKDPKELVRKITGAIARET